MAVELENNYSQEDKDVIIEIRNLKKYFPIQKGIFKKTVAHVKAVDDVSIKIKKGETVALVGESGCGKSTLGRCVMKIYDSTAGEINYYPKKPIKDKKKLDIADIEREYLAKLREEIQMIFQDPYSSLNPRMNILEILSEPFRFHSKKWTKEEIRDRVEYLLEAVGLRSSYLTRFPHEFSGGQLQRIAIARALALNPDIIVADEPVSALDVSIQGQIINLMKKLQKDLGLTYLFISHNLALVDRIADRIVVMYLGKVMEVATTSELVSNIKHPYTEALLSAVPIADPTIKQKRIILSGNIPSPSNPPTGCVFHTRCPYAKEKCKVEVPVLQEVVDGHQVACHFSEKLNLQKINL